MSAMLLKQVVFLAVSGGVYLCVFVPAITEKLLTEIDVEIYVTMNKELRGNGDRGNCGNPAILAVKLAAIPRRWSCLLRDGTGYHL